MSEDRFHWVDYLVFAITLLVSAAVGIFFGIRDRANKSTEEFLMASRGMQVLPVALSMYVSVFSAVSFLGDPVEVYTYGATYWFVAVGYSLSLIPAAYFFVPIYHKMKLVSVYEFLGTKYNFGMKQLGSIIYIINTMLYQAVVLYGPALALNQVSGLPVWASIVILGVVCTFYTTVGGMKAIIWADTIQMFVMLAGLLAIAIQGSIHVGGFGKVWQISKDGGRINLNKLNPSPLMRNTVWTYLIGGFSRAFNIYISSQTVVQRYCTISTVRKAQLSVYLNVPLFFITPTLLTFTGLVMYAVFHECDPLLSGRISKPDQLVPLLVVDILGFLPGVPGLFLACVFSASLSTLSSALGSIAATVLKDMVEPAYTRVCHQPMNDHTAACVAKCIGVLSGLLSIGLAFLVQLTGGGIFKIAVTISGVVGGPLAGVFILAAFMPSVDTLSAFLGFLVSLSFVLWMAVGSMVFPHMNPRLPVSTAGCEGIISTPDNFTITETRNNMLYSIGFNLTEHYSESGGLELYKFSPILYGTITVIITVLFAYIAHKIQDLASRWCCKPTEQSSQDSKVLTDGIEMNNFHDKKSPIYKEPMKVDSPEEQLETETLESSKPFLPYTYSGH